MFIKLQLLYTELPCLCLGSACNAVNRHGGIYDGLELGSLWSGVPEQMYRVSPTVADCHWSFVLPDQVDPRFSETVGGASGSALDPVRQSSSENYLQLLTLCKSVLVHRTLHIQALNHPSDEPTQSLF